MSRTDEETYKTKKLQQYKPLEMILDIFFAFFAVCLQNFREFYWENSCTGQPNKKCACPVADVGSLIAVLRIFILTHDFMFEYTLH